MNSTQLDSQFELCKNVLFKQEKIDSNLDEGLLERLNYFNVQLPGAKTENQSERTMF